MLNIICSPLTADSHSELVRAISKNLAEKKRCYLLVPEQQTLLSETDLAGKLPDEAPLYFEVTNFTRFANTTFRTIGGISGEACDKSRRALIMWRALTELSGVLTMTEAGREINAGLVDTAMKAIGEMQAEGLTADMLECGANDELKNRHRRLWGKLKDAASIYAVYKRLLGERYSDTSDELELAIKKLGERSDFLTDTEIYIEGFTSFTEPQYRLIGLLSARTSLTVFMPLPKARKDAFEYSETARAIERMKLATRRSGADVKQKFIDGRRASQRESISELSSLIWQKNGKYDNITLQNSEEIRIIEAPTPFDECDFISADIKRRVMGGASYNDFAIIHGTVSDIPGILKSSLERHSIPAFLSAGKDLSSYEAVKLIYTAYSVLLSGYRREDVITYAKCSLGGISREECDEFEIYANTWQISGKRFTDGILWNMNPRGYTAKRDESDDEKLIRINKTREKIVGQLDGFAERSANAKTVREQAEALYLFLREIGLERSLKLRAEKLVSLGENEYAEENLRLWGLICQALDTLVEVSADMPADKESFLGQLKILFSTMNIASIPTHVDEVTVGSLDMLRLYEKKHVYLVGAVAGSIPAAPQDTAFFSEKDKLTLATVGIPLEPQLEMKNAREMFILSRALSYANESVTVTYSRTNSKFKAVEPSAVIRTVCELAHSVSVVKTDALPHEERLWFAEDALGISDEKAPEIYSTVRKALESSGYSDRLEVVDGSISLGNATLGEDIRRELYGSSMRLTETRINSFTSCPLSYFCRFVLKLTEEKNAVFDASGVGSFIHSILEQFFSALSERTDSEPMSSEERQKLTTLAAESYARSLGESLSEGNIAARVKVNRLSRAALPIVEGLCDELSASAFRPKFFELPIGIGDGPEAISMTLADGSRLKVYGVVDRVDTYSENGKTYLRVIDYKTGHKEFSPEDLDSGENLQMFLYLKALIESRDEKFRQALGLKPGEKAVPAGVIYVKTSVSDVEVPLPDDSAAVEKVKSMLDREGMVTADEDLVMKMGLRYTPLYSARTPDKIPDSKRKFTFDEKGWDNLMQRVEKSLGEVAMRMRSGDVCAAPSENKKGKTHCEYCEFKPICRNAVIG